jgi:ABC-type multidrug transport system fused ATPase/permease subunit
MPADHAETSSTESVGLVAHRLSTIRHADLVLVVDSGHVVERGTHAELLRRGGRYAELYREFASALELEPAPA